MNSRLYKDVYGMMEEIPVISSHEHHLPESIQQTMTLDRVLDYAYIGWFAGRKHKPIAKTLQEDPLLQVHVRDGKYELPDDEWKKDPKTLANERNQYLDRFGYNSYWVWLEKGIQKIYGLQGEILPENWETVSNQISVKHTQPGAHLDIMRNDGGILHAVQDTYWDYSSDLDHPEFFSPTMRIDMFLASYNHEILDHDLNNPFQSFPEAPRGNFDDYLDFLKSLFLSWRGEGAVAMKCASAYERPLNFHASTRAQAANVFGKAENVIGQADHLAYSNFMFHWFCELNRQLDIPFQIHTGLAEISGSNPMCFEPTIRRYPDIQFVLFHAGYPWYSEIGGLAHNYSNVVIDMVWAPLISTSASIHALKEYIEVAQSSDLIGWGGDTWTSEEAVGAVLAWKHVIAMALSDMLESGYLNMKKAETLSQKLLFKNNAAIYKLPLP